MASSIYSQIPLVRDGKDVPFVIGVSDETPSFELSGIKIRRGPDTCYFSVILNNPICLNTTMQTSDGGWYLFASTGPMLLEWWSLITSGYPIPGCPLLSKVGSGGALSLTVAGVTVPVNVLSVPDPQCVVVVLGFPGALDDDAVKAGVMFSPALCLAALKILLEYRTLVGTVPNLDVALGGRPIPLSELLIYSESISAALPGEILA